KRQRGGLGIVALAMDQFAHGPAHLSSQPALVAVLALVAHRPANLIGRWVGRRKDVALELQQRQEDLRVDAVVAGLPEQHLGEGMLAVADLKREALERAGLRVE